MIFAKKSLSGLAKLFVQPQAGVKSWSILKKRLIEEFEQKVSSSQVHKMLMTRKQKKEESVQEYTLVMREIASRANVENEAIIQYIIDGILDDQVHKYVLYGAKTFFDFKEKVKVYEQMKAGEAGQKQRSSDHNATGSTRNFTKRNFPSNNSNNTQKIVKPETCFNCGSKGHKSVSCPDKNKGTKCFKCNGYGHIARACPGKISEESRNVNIIEVIPKNSVTLKINDVELNALLDTGSDISAVRKDIFDAHLQDVTLIEDIITLKGIGPNKVKTIGYFDKIVLIFHEEVLLRLHVVPKDALGFLAVIGSNVLEYFNISIDSDGVQVYQREKENYLMHIKVDNTSELSWEHIENQEIRAEVKTIFDNYQPQAIKTTDIKMNIVLKSEEPIYQSPRRLALPEKLIVEKRGYY